MFIKAEISLFYQLSKSKYPTNCLWSKVPLPLCDSFKSFGLQIIFDDLFCSSFWLMNSFKSLFLSCRLCYEKFQILGKQVIIIWQNTKQCPYKLNPLKEICKSKLTLQTIYIHMYQIAVVISFEPKLKILPDNERSVETCYITAQFTWLTHLLWEILQSYQQELITSQNHWWICHL